MKPKARRSVEAFVEGLDRASEYEGRPYGRAHALFEAEDAHAQEVLRFKGYLALSDAFKCFFLETTELLDKAIKPPADQPLSQFYGLLVPRLARSFTALCGAERTAILGYPFQGYTILRNIFDCLLHTSAALQGIVDFYGIEGMVPGEAFDKGKAKRLRKRTEMEANRRMTGEASGLAVETIAELKVWDDLFDYETHGGRLSATHAKGWIEGRAPLNLLPLYRDNAWVLFMNRSTEVQWMCHRLLPNLQPVSFPLGDIWGEKWRLLDLSFMECVSALTEELGKPIGNALVDLVESKFSFSADSRFSL